MFTRIQDVAPGAIQTYTAKSALFSTVVGDRGTLFDNTGSYTITLGTTSLTAGWSCWFRNVSGTQTLDPAGAVTINGAATYSLSNAGDIVQVIFDGTNFLVQHAQRPSTVAITGGAIDGTTIGATTATTGRFTTITATGLTSGRVPYVSTAGLLVDEADFLFDGSTLTVNQANGTLPSISGVQGVFARTAAGNNGGLAVIASDTGVSQFLFGDTASVSAGAFRYDHNTDSMAFRTNGATDRFTIASDGAAVLTTNSTGLTISKTTGTTLVVSSTATNSATFAGGATFGGLLAVTEATPSTFTLSDATTTSSPETVMFRHNTSGTPGNGFGQTVSFLGQSSTTTNQYQFAFLTIWADATHASRKARTIFNVYDTAAREAFRFEASGSAPMIGFLGASAVVRYATTGTTTGFTAGAGSAVLSDSTFTGNTGATAYTVGDLVRCLKQYGLLTS